MGPTGPAGPAGTCENCGAGIEFPEGAQADSACAFANAVIEGLKAMVKLILDGLQNGSTMIVVLGAVLALISLILSAGSTALVIMGLIAAVWGVGYAAANAQFDTAFWDHWKSYLYAAANNDGSFDAGGMACLTANINPGDSEAEAFVWGIIQILGVDGLNKLAYANPAGDSGCEGLTRDLCPWHCVFDFSLDPCGWIGYNQFGHTPSVWEAGIGWKAAYDEATPTRTYFGIYDNTGWVSDWVMLGMAIYGRTGGAVEGYTDEWIGMYLTYGSGAAWFHVENYPFETDFENSVTWTVHDVHHVFVEGETDSGDPAMHVSTLEIWGSGPCPWPAYKV